MGLFNILKDKLRATNENNAIEDDTKLYTQVIYNTFNNFVVLISYSSDYATQVVEFLDACNTAGLKFITMQSSYESDADEEGDKEEQKEEEFAIRPEKIQHQRQYIVLSGNIHTYSGIYSCIDALSNDILLAVQDDIYNNCSSTYFNEHIKNGVLNFNEFKYRKIAPQYDKEISLETTYYKETLLFNNPRVIMSKLPSGFMEKDILQIIRVHKLNDDYGFSMLKLLKDQYDSNKCDEHFIKDFSDVYSMVIGDITEEKIHRLLFMPKYTLQDDDIFIGDVDDERLDDIFRQHYDKFTGVTDDSLNYMDIDEILKEGEENGNG
jgi:hypothetical protein